MLTDSRGLNDDLLLDSYLQMATLSRIIDNMPTKNVFVIFDVCFGSSFDLNAKDLELSRYSELDLDISLSDFVERKSNKISRIFLASGRYRVPDYWDNSLDHSPFAKKTHQVFKRGRVFY